MIIKNSFLFAHKMISDAKVILRVNGGIGDSVPDDVTSNKIPRDMCCGESPRVALKYLEKCATYRV